jgi:Holliday junction resolvasome RuvABC ATP-dependent DNA helicase subunit
MGWLIGTVVGLMVRYWYVTAGIAVYDLTHSLPAALIVGVGSWAAIYRLPQMAAARAADPGRHRLFCALFGGAAGASWLACYFSVYSSADSGWAVVTLPLAVLATASLAAYLRHAAAVRQWAAEQQAAAAWQAPPGWQPLPQLQPQVQPAPAPEPAPRPPRPLEEIWAEVDGLVGLAQVKEFLRGVAATVEVSHRRQAEGLPPIKQTLHMCFYGNPGTGKTTVARLTGELLAALGALPSGHLVEVDRSGLVAGYVGQTALKVQDAVRRAMGGVLFVDEAYSLARGGEWDFGREALDALVKAMEDHRDRLCVILAGYEREMAALFRLNPGLESRIAFICRFPDYTPEECLEIACREARKQGYQLSFGAQRALYARFSAVDLGVAGNGRYARRLVEAAIRNHALRASQGRAADLVTLEACDFEGVE